MKIILDKVSKRFDRDWLFKDLDYQLQLSNSYAITGPNGSGKTTLLKVIAGIIPCSNGTVTHLVDNITVDPDLVYQHISYVAPYLEVPEDLTLNEFFSFHLKLKPPVKGTTLTDIATRAGLFKALHKPIHTFSSGMKQRLKLALGLFCSAPILMMDEPTTNLDEPGIAWYIEEVRRIKSKKLLIISSNQVNEYGFCDHEIALHP